jgi:hypothetical protein
MMRAEVTMVPEKIFNYYEVSSDASIHSCNNQLASYISNKNKLSVPILKVADNQQDPVSVQNLFLGEVRIHGSGSVPKCHRIPAILVQIKYRFKQYRYLI